MKKQMIFLCLLSVVLIQTVKAQENEISNKMSLGFQLNQYQRDFGLGIQATTPYFAQGNMAVRFRANYMYLEHLDTENLLDLEMTWTPYFNICIGLVGVSGKSAILCGYTVKAARS